MVRKQLRSACRSRGGFALVEVLVASGVLTIAVVGMAGAMLSSMALQRSESESTIARLSAQQVLETMQAVDFSEVWACYNASTADDAGLVTPARGATFVVQGLTPVEGDADGRCGSIEFPETNGALREDVVDAALGMPMDLDGNGTVDTANHASDYTLLPVRVRVDWRGPSGPQVYQLETILCLRANT